MARKVYYKVRIGKGSKRHSFRYLSTEFKKKSSATTAAKRFAHGRVVKRRHVTHKRGR